MVDNLIGIDPYTAQAVPELATSWETSSDGSVWTFHLRKGVQFHNNWGEFTAKDVKYNVERLCRPDTRLSTCVYLAGAVVEKKRVVPIDQIVEIVDDYTVNVTFHDAKGKPRAFGWGDFVWSTNSNELAMESSAHFGAKGIDGLDKDGIQGTGPYKYKERKLGQSIILEKKPEKDWKSRDPDFPEFEIPWIPEDAARYAALLAGEIHVTDLPLDLQADARGKKYLPLYSQYTSRNVFLLFGGMHFSSAPKSKAAFDPNQPTNDVRVRKAMNMAINREEMQEFLYPGISEIMYVGNYHPAQPGWDPAWPERYKTAYKFNPEGAKQLLREAGYGPDNPIKLKAMSYASPGEAETPQIMEAVCTLYWAKVGIQCELVDMDSGTAVQKWVARDTINWVWVNLIGFFPQEYWLTVAYTSASFIHHYEDDKVDAYVKTLEGIGDPKTRDDLFREVGNYFFDNYIEAPLFWFRQAYIADPKIIADWIFPGNAQATQYLYLLKAVKK